MTSRDWLLYPGTTDAGAALISRLDLATGLHRVMLESRRTMSSVRGSGRAESKSAGSAPGVLNIGERQVGILGDPVHSSVAQCMQSRSASRPPSCLFEHSVHCVMGQQRPK